MIYGVYLSGCTSFRWMFPAFSRMGNNQSYPESPFSYSVNHRIKDILILEYLRKREYANREIIIRQRYGKKGYEDMELDYFKDKTFELLDEGSDLEIVDIDTDDLKNIFTIKIAAGSIFEVECRKLV